MKLRRFLIALDAWFGSFSYYDEETDDVVIDGDEDDCYNCLMQTDEFHLIVIIYVSRAANLAHIFIYIVSSAQGTYNHINKPIGGKYYGI